MSPELAIVGGAAVDQTSHEPLMRRLPTAALRPPFAGHAEQKAALSGGSGFFRSQRTNCAGLSCRSPRTRSRCVGAPVQSGWFPPIELGSVFDVVDNSNAVGELNTR
jgi:hypothetical protein